MTFLIKKKIIFSVTFYLKIVFDFMQKKKTIVVGFTFSYEASIFLGEVDPECR